MQEQFLSLNIGNILTLLSVVAGWAHIYLTQRTNAEAERVRQEIRAKELEEKIQERHEENRDMLTNLRIKVEGLSHLDPCMDELKESVKDLGREFARCGQRNNWRGFGDK